jgi:two-component system, chemotaxis family, CheB/CheR fusion protein
VAVIDAAQQVQIWNRHAQDLWGLRPDEVEGQHILALDVGFPTERLKQPIRSVLGGGEERVELEFDATNRKGRPVSCQITLMPLRVGNDGTIGAIVLMEANDGRR